jgi:hypothetical protein
MVSCLQLFTLLKCSIALHPNRVIIASGQATSLCNEKNGVNTNDKMVSVIVMNNIAASCRHMYARGIQ